MLIPPVMTYCVSQQFPFSSISLLGMSTNAAFSCLGESMIWQRMGVADFYCENVAHIQGIMMDVRQVMYSLRPMPESDKKLLAECVETGFGSVNRK